MPRYHGCHDYKCNNYKDKAENKHYEDCAQVHCLCNNCIHYNSLCCINHDGRYGFGKIISCMPYDCYGCFECEDFECEVKL